MAKYFQLIVLSTQPICLYTPLPPLTPQPIYLTRLNAQMLLEALDATKHHFVVDPFEFEIY